MISDLMSVLVVFNVFCIGFSWWVASLLERYSAAWWLNMGASALNAVIVLAYFTGNVLS
jgi:hypothetical protein